MTGPTLYHLRFTFLFHMPIVSCTERPWANLPRCRARPPWAPVPCRRKCPVPCRRRGERARHGGNEVPRDGLVHKVSNEKNPGWLGFIGGYTTQLYRDYFIYHEIRIPIKETSIMESRRVFFVAQVGTGCRSL